MGKSREELGGTGRRTVGGKPEWSPPLDEQARAILAADLEAGPKLAQFDRAHVAAAPLPFAPWDGGEWMVTPIVALLRSLGYQVQIHEGYVWEEAHGVFKRWGETLWAARLGFRAGDYEGTPFQL